ncbi:gamma-butyrobetaine dioxygenase-like [Dendronephthya gigantea]|uniref:gamma-butyrobetaine dioxygenase-like n=1 Tax=Dendronephthya gigantea TaxID=151771 RepID=UPI00106D94DD|nr:gamma-butyrobetaine dioxygenase-like [Dendronephthya gigantea]
MFSKIGRSISSQFNHRRQDLKKCLELQINSYIIRKTVYRRVSNLSNESDTMRTAIDKARNSSSYMKEVFKELGNRNLNVTWSDGTVSRFPYNFLRDNCKCSQCYESSSKQKLFNTARDLKKDIQIEELVVLEDGKHLKCIWSGGHESKYPFGWLHKMKMPEKNECLRRNSNSLVKDELILWNRETMRDNIPFQDYNLMMNEDKSLFDSLYSFYQHGFVVINNAPARDGVLMELAERIGYMRTTHYGNTFNVKDIENPSNLAYTNQHLPFHTDMPFMVTQPDIQLLHCINENTAGGDSIFVDGFNVANQLHKDHPDAFDVLRNFHVRYCDYGTDAYSEFIAGDSKPIIKLNRHGRLNEIAYNPSVESESKGDCTPDELLAFYDACYLFTKVLYDSNNIVDMHLKSGQIAMFDNGRVLHGRSEFEATGGPTARWLQGIYFEWDVIFSKLRVLQGKLGLKEPYLPEQSDEFF